MLQINKNGNIRVNKGDTFKVPLFIDCYSSTLKSTRLPWRYNDKILFHILEPNKLFEDPIIAGEFTYEDLNENNDIIISFEAEDLDKLCPGTYYYEVKIVRKVLNEVTKKEEEKVITLISTRKLQLI